LPERVAPRRNEHSVIAGALVGVLTVTISTFGPRTPEYPGALLLVAVDLADGVVHVDEHEITVAGPVSDPPGRLARDRKRHAAAARDHG